MKIVFPLIVACMFGGGVAGAAPITFIVRDQSGAPIEGAVVSMVQPETHVTKSADHYVMEQRDLQFVPFVLVVPKGADVEFPNRDKARHHVYSFSKGNRFELKLYGREEERSVAFEKTGIAALGCNIHDQMIAFIKVVENVAAGSTDENGLVQLEVGQVADKVSVWHPYHHVSREMEVAFSSEMTAAALAGTPISITLEVEYPTQK